MLSRLKRKWWQFRTTLWQRTAEFLVRLSVFEAKLYLKKRGPLTVLVDNSLLGHGVTHVSVWVDTGETKWGGVVPIKTGYAARVPVHSAANDSRLYTEITYLVGLTELARSGLIKFVTSAELQAEADRHPIGRFKGYGYDDVSLFDGLDIPSVDGYHWSTLNAQQEQRRRLEKVNDEEFREIVSLLGQKSDLDAWHIYTVIKFELNCFLHMDFKLEKKINANAKMKSLESKVLTPSQLGKSVGLRSIPTFLLSYRGAKWQVHPDIHVPEQKRPSSRRNTPLPPGWREYTDEPAVERDGGDRTMVTVLPRVGKMNGLSINYGHEPVHIQYEDQSGNLHELRMGMGDAMYLLSLLKSAQLNLNIPFPDDPRDPNAVPIRPSDRVTGSAEDST